MRETCTLSGAFSASLGTHDEISQVPTVPTDASNATILELSAHMTSKFRASVRANPYLFRSRLSNHAISLMSHGTNRSSISYFSSSAKYHARTSKID